MSVISVQLDRCLKELTVSFLGINDVGGGVLLGVFGL